MGHSAKSNYTYEIQAVRSSSGSPAPHPDSLFLPGSRLGVRQLEVH